MAREDFIAYRSEYAVSHKRIEQLKNALNFQDKQSVEKISPPQNIFDEPKDSLQKHFKIYDLTPYESTLISDLDFNTRILRCLEANNYVTLAEEALDEFLRSAALKRDPQIDLIIAAFETFSTSVRIKNFLKCLPEEIKLKSARPFPYACSLNNVDFFSPLCRKICHSQNCPNSLPKKSLLLALPILKLLSTKFALTWKLAQKKIAAVLSQREFEIVRRTAEGATLEETGRVLGITRERVRQPELISLERFKRYGSDVRRIFYFLHALTDGKSLITLDDMKAFVNTDDAEIIYFLAAKVDLRSDIFQFDKGRNSFVFHNGIGLDENELSKNLLDIMDENIFEAEIETLAREKKSFSRLDKS